jgi:hypothetical protein
MRLQEHVQVEHNNNQKVSIEVIPFPGLVPTVNTPTSESLESAESSKHDDPANLASGEESTTDASSSFSLGLIRGRQPYISVRPTISQSL